MICLKKFKGIMMVALSFLVLLTVTGCGNKTAISADDFKTKLEDKGYTVQDATDQMNGVEEIKKVYIAIDADEKYQIEFYELNNEDNASVFFNENKEKFEKTKSSTNSETSSSMGNYSKYALTTNGTYKAVSRVGRTVIYIDVEDDNKSKVQSILKELDY